MQRVIFNKLVLSGFKNHEELTVDFGETTKVSGRNGAGKSAISEAVTWLLFGVDTFGSTKFDPTPIGSKSDTKVSLLMSRTTEEGEVFETKLEKELVKGKAKYSVNDVPEKATDYEAIINKVFDKNYFLSIFNPGYFFSQHWKEQREQLLTYVSEPLNSEVLKTMGGFEVKALEERLKKHSVEELEKIYSPIYKTKDKEIERAGERVLTLKEQLEHAKAQAGDKETAEANLKAINEKLTAAKVVNERAKQQQKEFNSKEYRIDQINHEINRLKDKVISLQQKEIENDCPKCGQDLGEESKAKAIENHKQEIKTLSVKGSELVAERKDLKAELADMILSEETVDVAQLQEDKYLNERVIEAYKNVEYLEAEVEKAEQNKQTIRKERNDAQSIIESCKSFHTAKSELMVEKVGGLFDLLTVKLFDKKKNGSITPTFEIEYQGKPYNKLSTAEKIKAGLELIEALIVQAQKRSPVFVDNAESVLSIKKPSAQLITATVKDEELKIEKGDE